MKILVTICIASILVLLYCLVADKRVTVDDVTGRYVGCFRNVQETVSLLNNHEYVHEVTIGNDYSFKERGAFVLQGREITFSNYTVYLSYQYLRNEKDISREGRSFVVHRMVFSPSPNDCSTYLIVYPDIDYYLYKTASGTNLNAAKTGTL